MTQKKKFMLLVMIVLTTMLFYTGCGAEQPAEASVESILLGDLIDFDSDGITGMGYEEQPAPGRRAYISAEEMYCYRSGERRETTHGDSGKYIIERLSKLLQAAELTPAEKKDYDGSSCRVWLEGENAAELRFRGDGLVEVSQNEETVFYTTAFDPQLLVEHFATAWTIAPLADYLQYEALEGARMIAVQNCYPQESGQMASAEALADVDRWMRELYVQPGNAEPLFEPQYRMYFEMQFAGMTVPQQIDLNRNGLYYNGNYYKIYDFTPEYRAYDLDEVCALFEPWTQSVAVTLGDALSSYLDVAEISSIQYTRETKDEYGSWDLAFGLSDALYESVENTLSAITVEQIPKIPEEMYTGEPEEDVISMQFQEISGITDYWRMMLMIYDREYVLVNAYNIDDTNYYAYFRLTEPLDRSALEAVFPEDSYHDMSHLLDLLK